MHQCTKPELYNINAQSLVKIHWHLLKLLSVNEISDVLQADNCQKLKKFAHLPISNPKPDLFNINIHTKFYENPLTFTLVIVRKRKYGQT